MHLLHKPRNAKTEANYHAYYQTLIKNGTANRATSNAYLPSSGVPFKTKCIIMKYRTGTLYNHKHAVLLKLKFEQYVRTRQHSTSQTCPLCPQVDSALHILSGCQHTQIRNMITEGHNLACHMIFKAISKTGFFGSCIVSKDIGSNERMTMQNLQIPETAESRIVPK
jgi:predicted ester cyclase